MIAPIFGIGPVVADMQSRSLKLGQRSCKLTDTEARILGYLHDNAGRNCSKSAIYKHAFFRDYSPGDKTLDVYIGRLRGKLRELDADSAAFLQTVRGSGYKLESSEPGAKRPRMAPRRRAGQAAILRRSLHLVSTP